MCGFWINYPICTLFASMFLLILETKSVKVSHGNFKMFVHQYRNVFDLFTFLNISFCFLLKDEKWYGPEGWNFTQPIFHKYFLASYCWRLTLQDTLQILEPKSHYKSLNTAIRQQSSLKVLNSYLYPETASVYYQQTLPHKIYCSA